MLDLAAHNYEPCNRITLASRKNQKAMTLLKSIFPLTPLARLNNWIFIILQVPTFQCSLLLKTRKCLCLLK